MKKSKLFLQELAISFVGTIAGIIGGNLVYDKLIKKDEPEVLESIAHKVDENAAQIEFIKNSMAELNKDED